ncbi:MAG: SPOR domain-containing protein [Deltaproteobacteria bacterium]|nr:SPOR domain-containing protein [Deltaproteobacteria bacterium]
MSQQGGTSDKKLFLLLLVILFIGAFVLLVYLVRAGKTRPDDWKTISARIKVEAPEPAQVETQPQAPLPAATSGPEAKKEEPKAAVPSESKKTLPRTSPAGTRPPEKNAGDTGKPEKLVPAPKKAAAYKAWAVHVASVETKKGAVELKKSLTKAGYNAYVTEFRSEGVEWYRVRVGFYGTKKEAGDIANKLTRLFKNGSTYPVRPAKGEVKKHTK